MKPRACMNYQAAGVKMFWITGSDQQSLYSSPAQRDRPCAEGHKGWCEPFVPLLFNGWRRRNIRHMMYWDFSIRRFWKSWWRWVKRGRRTTQRKSLRTYRWHRKADYSQRLSIERWGWVSCIAVMFLEGYSALVILGLASFPSREALLCSWRASLCVRFLLR